MTNATVKSPYYTAWRLPILLMLLIIGPIVLIDNYTAGLLVQAYIFALLALIADILWGYTGILTFASAAMFGIGAYTVGAIFVHVSTSAWVIPFAFAIAVALACALSALVGWLAFYSRITLS